MTGRAIHNAAVNPDAHCSAHFTEKSAHHQNPKCNRVDALCVCFQTASIVIEICAIVGPLNRRVNACQR